MSTSEEEVAVFCGWEGNRRSDLTSCIPAATRHRLYAWYIHVGAHFSRMGHQLTARDIRYRAAADTREAGFHTSVDRRRGSPTVRI